MSLVQRISMSFISSAILYTACMFYLYQTYMSDCVGCGIAPDGKTDLGPHFFSDYVFSGMLIFFVILFVVIFCILLFLRRKK